MMRITRFRAPGGVLLCLLMIAACGKTEEPKPAPAPAPDTSPAPAPEPVGVQAGTIELGKGIGADKKISTPTDTFARNDTIYVSVDTTGTGSATLSARWTYEKDGQVTVVNEETQTISATGPATTEFHISKPGGWPAGTYQVEISVDGRPVGTKKFTVA